MNYEVIKGIEVFRGYKTAQCINLKQNGTRQKCDITVRQIMKSVNGRKPLES